MGKIMWACWDGGGNLTPSLGIARVLEGDGHDVHFFGRPDMVNRVRSAGFGATALLDSYRYLDRYSFHPQATVFGYTSSPAVGEELLVRCDEFRPDLVVIDAMFSAALDVAPRFERPTAVMLHTFLHHIYTGWTNNFKMQSDSRQRCGFDPLPGLDVLWGERDLLHVNALETFDAPAATPWTNVAHGAPILASERRAVPVSLPWPDDDDTPLVLLSFSTVPEQRNAELFQRALDALGPLDVHVVATTGGTIDASELIAPANAVVVAFADHDALMARASLVLGHGGHGTTMRALKHGLPIVGVPATGGDQVPITQLLEQWGAGRALPGDAAVDQIRDTVDAVLNDDRCRIEAQRRADFLRGVDGAGQAARAVEALLG